MTQFNHLREKLVVAASYHKPRHCSLKSMAKRPVFCFCFFFGGGKVKFRSKTAREVHGNGQDTAWSQSSNQTPRNKKWGITIQNVKYLAYCNLCMNLFPLLSNCLNSLIPPPSRPPPQSSFVGMGDHRPPPPQSSFVGMGENHSWCIVKHLLSLLSVT